MTLPKLNVNKDNKRGFANKQEKKGTNFINTETTGYTNTNNKLLSTEKENANYSKEGEPLNENIKEILYDQDIMDKYEEEKGKFLYEKLKTRYNNFDSNNSSENNKKGRKNWSKPRKRNIPSDYELIATPKQIGEFDYNLGQAFIKGKFRFLTNKQKENLGYIGELNLFNSMNRLKEKQNIIKEIKNEQRKKILLPIDVFKYDAEKWKKYTYEKNKSNNDVIINDLNEKNKVKLDDMKEYIDKLNNDASNYDKDVNNIINNIDIFLDKYGADSNNPNMTRKNSRGSDYSLKSIKVKKKDKEKDKENKDRDINKSIRDEEKKEDLKLNLDAV